ncbi:uncharacterized protein K452DRAFT_18771 [Aplosporella prunicola CBS 121167]|uniref:Secreted protein n=1 Tax=Aplosporella prunicola CBS 121167 TaxID=1176127 RepID=A0A6A6BE45_9PEZI|nr:uncharacterized protein K452DRAFT_18771 [Aplosporella prunicola CBS 121167]KAF2142440.1 hypothetical protein K452DRAFT_18771 [Aplosporella prunicola CBS 121167]
MGGTVSVCVCVCVCVRQGWARVGLGDDREESSRASKVGSSRVVKGMRDGGNALRGRCVAVVMAPTCCMYRIYLGQAPAAVTPARTTTIVVVRDKASGPQRAGTEYGRTHAKVEGGGCAASLRLRVAHDGWLALYSWGAGAIISGWAGLGPAAWGLG